jgi:hypothetical protein
VVVPLADLGAGVADLAHHDVLAHFGVVHQRVAGVPAALVQLDHRTPAWPASRLSFLDTWSGFHGDPCGWQNTRSLSAQAGPAFIRALR